MNMSMVFKILDEFIESNKLDFVSAVEAASILDRAGILKDRPDRPGAPLRALLRDGMLPHAYQTGGKGSEWRIPTSRKGVREGATYSGISPRPRYRTDKSTRKNDGLQTGSEKYRSIEERVRKAREAYLPKTIRCLLVAEAPPETLERFFYYPDVRRADYLFLGVMGVLDQASKNEYLSSGRSTELKKKLLKNFMGRGFYLADLCDVPLGVYRKPLAEVVPDFIRNISKFTNLKTPIILIKGTVFDVAARPLAYAGYVKVIQERIPFPGQGWQREFHEKFSFALKKVGMK